MASEENLERLVLAAQGGDEGAFARLYESLNPLLLRFLDRICTGRDEAEEVAADVWLRLWAERLGSYRREIGSLRAYLWRIAHNRAIDRLRVQRRAGPPARDPEGSATHDPASLRDRSQSLEEIEALDLEAILRAHLNERERELLSLLLQGLNPGEICERMQLSQPSVWRLRARLQATTRELFRNPPER